MKICTVCLDDEEDIGYACVDHNCPYQLCSPCIRRAFEDVSGANYNRCPMCSTPMARHLLEARCGEGAIKAVERELRNKVEFDVKQEYLRKEKAKREMKEMTVRASELYNELSDRLNMRCPRCSMVFFDYSGCNALTCGNDACKAKFCAVCLKDCGRDAHPHVRQHHGNLFDKGVFERSRKKREEGTFHAFLEEIADEPFEVKQLVKQHHGKSAFVESEQSGLAVGSRFLSLAKDKLRDAVKMDRLAVLSNAECFEYMRRGLSVDDISPRLVIPEDYKLSLIRQGSGTYTISLQWDHPTRGWMPVPLPSESDENGPKNTGVNEDDFFKDRAQVDSLSNIRYSLRCGVIAFRGATKLYQARAVKPAKGMNLSEDQVALKFAEVDRRGQMREVIAELPFGVEAVVLGVNQNLRLVLLEQHAEATPDEVLMFDPLRSFVGEKQASHVFSEILLPAPNTFGTLNDEQKKVAHPLGLKTAMDVAGPPGTGKSYTITELVRSILECTTADVLVLSERNGAIDAIAEKFADACLDMSKSKELRVHNVMMWTDLMAFGSSGVGPHTKLFTLPEKLKYHPELVELRRLEKEKKAMWTALGEAMRDAIVKRLEDLSNVIPRDAIATKTRKIANNEEPGLTTPGLIVATMKSCVEAITNVIDQDMSVIREEEVGNLVLDHDDILTTLIAVRTKPEMKRVPWKTIRKDVIYQLKCIQKKFRILIDEPLFSFTRTEDALSRLRDAQESTRLAEQRLQSELISKARVNLCTIGSSHRLPVASVDDDDDSIGALINALGSSSLDSGKETVVIIDEAGCIPLYEFLGLSRLGKNIIGLTCVGDKHQLPPYDGTQFGGAQRNSRLIGRQGSFGGVRPERRMRCASAPTPSLLDASRLTLDQETKVKLTTQYRVPRDIAGILNDRVYKGDYNTDGSFGVPDRGFRFVHVPEYRGDVGKKYVNEEEVEYCIELIRQFKREGQSSIMVLTPYKKQQREIQFQVKKRGYENIPVLTIDQCQGQEADFVVLSLVQKPTRFLNRNRFNVALSRVRKTLYMLADKAKFRAASMDSNWECSLMAKDLLCLSASENC